ncbi:ABC transporter ATP-binding protein [Sutterella sp.]|uniref:ABC transporter ATP-binding protein n=1 Tax=Sutterella sp. TaxID=1981025 RepID=UPI0025D501A9|nr:ABC transporter ATP-binding protein [uncultured Sutterella sp.]
MADFDLTLPETELRVPDGEETRLIFSTSGFTLPEGAVLGVRGASGAGKSTFLKLLSGILTPTRGAVRWGAVNLSLLTESARDRWRGEHCGFLFQDFRLFEDLTAEENVLLPTTFTRALRSEDHVRARGLLKARGVRPDTRARLLSRGEMQRTALARVLFAEPQVILADEPTASLDRLRAAEAVEALLEAARTLGATLILVSHDERVLLELPRLVEVADGRLIDLSGRR